MKGDGWALRRRARGLKVKRIRKSKVTDVQGRSIQCWIPMRCL